MIIKTLNGEEIELHQTNEGFKFKKMTVKGWEYVKKDQLLKMVHILNATQGYLPAIAYRGNVPGYEGRFNLDITINERSGFALTKERSIFRNLAFILSLLYYESVEIDGKWCLTFVQMNTNEYETRLRHLLEFSDSHENKFSLSEYIKNAKNNDGKF